MTMSYHQRKLVYSHIIASVKQYRQCVDFNLDISCLTTNRLTRNDNVNIVILDMLAC